MRRRHARGVEADRAPRRRRCGARGDGPAAGRRRRLRAAVAGRRRSRRTPARAAGPVALRARTADSSTARDPRRRRDADLASCARGRPADRRREGALARRVHHVDVGGARPSVQRTRRRARTRVRARVAATRIATRRRCSSTATSTEWNALEAGDGFKLVDPDGLLAEPEYDLGIIMREDPLEGDLHERARWLAHTTGLDERRSGSGASSSASRPACSARESAFSRSQARCSPPRIGWPVNADAGRVKGALYGPLKMLHRADALRGCEPGEPGGCPAGLWQRLGRTQTPFNVVLVHVYTQHTHAVERGAA